MREKLQHFIKNKLQEHGDTEPFADSDSLLISNRLDSLDTMELVVFLEQEFAVDFGAIGFDQTFIDSINAIITLIENYPPSK